MQAELQLNAAGKRVTWLAAMARVCVEEGGVMESEEEGDKVEDIKEKEEKEESSDKEGADDDDAVEKREEAEEGGGEEQDDADLTSVLLSWLGRGEPERRAVEQEVGLSLQPADANATSTGAPVHRSAPLATSACSCGAPARYRCPGCSAVSCSLECVKSHKLRTRCTGRRDEVAYTPLNAMSDATLRSDMEFLNRVSRDKLTRRTGNSNHTSSQRHQRTALAPRLRTLVSQARKRGVRLLLLPEGMSRRKHNSSHFDPTKHCIVWHIRWHLPNGKQLSSIALDSTPLSALWQAARTADTSDATTGLGTELPTHFTLLRDPPPAPPTAREKSLNGAASLASGLHGETILEQPCIAVEWEATATTHTN